MDFKDLNFLKHNSSGVSRNISLAVALTMAASIGLSSISAIAADVTTAKPASKNMKLSKKQKASEKTGPSKSKGKLSREVVFDGSVVNGKYLASGEAVSTVENEKKLNNLIGMRADFKDRLEDQRAQLRTVSDK